MAQIRQKYRPNNTTMYTSPTRVELKKVTGVNIHIITPAVCLVVIFYTCVGGIKAVIWTDVIQTVIMVGSMILVMIKGTRDVGGLGVVIQRNYESGRFEAPIWSIDPTIRHTMWSLVIGGTTFWTGTQATNQAMIQRFFSLPSKKSGLKALWIFVFGILLIWTFCAYNGLLTYATYYDCDPLTTKLAKAKDQLIPLLVMNVLGDYPGLPGCFVAGVFSAALSSLSTGLNSLAAVTLEDFCKPCMREPPSEKKTAIIMRLAVIVFGILSVALVFVVERLGAVLQLSMSISGMSYGPLLGIFTIGVLIPWIDSKGALIGGMSGFLIMGWVTLRAQASIALGEMTFPTKPTSVAGCTYEFENSTFLNLEMSSETTDVEKSLHHMSYLYYTLSGCVITCVVGFIANVILGKQNPKDVDPALLAPFIRKWFADDLKRTETTLPLSPNGCVTYKFEDGSDN